MNDAVSLQLGQGGAIALPKALRDRYNLQPGDQLELIDLDGVFLLSPERSQVDYLADQVAKGMLEQGETLESVMISLREERVRYALSSGNAG